MSWWKFWRWLAEWRKDWRESRRLRVSDDTLARIRVMPGEWWRDE